MSRLEWKLLTRKRESATKGVPPGKEALAWVTITVTLIYGERDAVLVDTFLSEQHSKESLRNRCPHPDMPKILHLHQPWWSVQRNEPWSRGAKVARVMSSLCRVMTNMNRPRTLTRRNLCLL
jgi:hypothetical protein